MQQHKEQVTNTSASHQESRTETEQITSTQQIEEMQPLPHSIESEAKEAKAPEKKTNAFQSDKENLSKHVQWVLQKKSHYSNSALLGFLKKNDVRSMHISFVYHYQTIYPLVELLLTSHDYKNFNDLLEFLATNKIPFDPDESFSSPKTLLEIAFEEYGTTQNIRLLPTIQLLILAGASVQKIILDNDSRYDLISTLMDCSRPLKFFHASNLSLLHNVARSDLIPLAQFLIQKNEFVALNFFDKQRRSALHYPVMHGLYEMAQLLFQAGVPPFADQSPEAVLVHGVETNDNKEVARAIRAGAHTNILTKNGQHLLAVAAHNKNPEILIALLLHKVSITYIVAANDIKTMAFIIEHAGRYLLKEARETIINFAKTNGTSNNEMINYLTDFNQRTLFEEHEEAANQEELQAIMAKNAEIKKQRLCYSRKEMEFLIAVKNSDFKSAETIVVRNPEIQLTKAIPGIKKNILLYCLDTKNINFLAYLIKNHFKRIYPLVQDLIKTNDLEHLSQLLKLGFKPDWHITDPNACTYQNDKTKLTYTLLQFALEENPSKDIITLLLTYGASIITLLEESSFTISEAKITALSEALETIQKNHALVALFTQLKRTATDTWDLGIQIHEALTNRESTSAISMLHQVLPAAPTMTDQQPFSEEHKEQDVPMLTMTSPTTSTSQSSSKNTPLRLPTMATWIRAATSGIAQ